jgi:GTP-binding protein EngB required for normal cell division
VTASPASPVGAGSALLDAVAETLPTLEALLAHAAPLGPEASRAIAETLAAIRGRLARETLAVAVVGEKKSGKSTFLNAVLGARVLGTAVRECTGTVTTIRHSDQPDYEARFVDGHVERFAGKVPPMPAELEQAMAEAERAVAEGTWPAAAPWGTGAFPDEQAAWEAGEACEEARPGFWALHRRRLASQGQAHEAYRQYQFAQDLGELTDMARRGGQVVALRLGYPGRHLPPGLTILDTPGANTDHAENQARAWQAIREQADGCVLVSDLQQVMSRSTRDFLQELRQVVPHVLLVLTKADRAHDNAEGDDPAEQLAEARRVGLSRFAKELGRAPEELLAISVAAEPALRATDAEAPEAREFGEAVDRLFALLIQERGLVLGARAATALGEGIRRIGQAQERAEAHYAEAIARMEAQRIQAPGAFRDQRLKAAKPIVLEQVVVAVEACVQQFRLDLARLETRWTLQVTAAASQDELKAQLPAWAATHGDAIDALAEGARDALERQVGALLHGLVLAAHDELLSRYRLARGAELTGAARPLELPIPSLGAHGLGLQAGLSGAVSAFEADQFKLQAGGAAAGAAIGTLFAPGLGTAVGALFGSMAGHLFGLDMLKEDCQTQIREGLARAEQAVAASLRADREAYEAAVTRQLDAAMTQALDRFHASIAGLMADEAQRLEAARRDLAGLLALRDRLAAHEALLTRRMAEAVGASRGLSAR